MKRFIPLFVAAAHAGFAVGAEDDHAHHHEQQASQEPTESELRHVPPAPPRFAVAHTSIDAMIESMEMDDSAMFGKVLLDQVERGEGGTLGWDGQAWYGGDYNKLWLKTEGEHDEGEATGNVEALWDRVIARWWDLQTGVRHDFGEGPSRTWAAFGVQGLAPYRFEVEATAYVGTEGRTAVRLVGEYELLLTQRWVLQPHMELNLYGKEDAENLIGSGLSDLEVGLRLRYEIRREFAPYVGLVWSRYFGGTADFMRDTNQDVSDAQFVAGMRIWF